MPKNSPPGDNPSWVNALSCRRSQSFLPISVQFLAFLMLPSFAKNRCRDGRRNGPNNLEFAIGLNSTKNTTSPQCLRVDWSDRCRTPSVPTYSGLFTVTLDPSHLLNLFSALSASVLGQ